MQNLPKVSQAAGNEKWFPVFFPWKAKLPRIETIPQKNVGAFGKNIMLYSINTIGQDKDKYQCPAKNIIYHYDVIL